MILPAPGSTRSNTRSSTRALCGLYDLMADAVLGDAVPVSPDIGSFFKLPGADNEPAPTRARASH